MLDFVPDSAPLEHVEYNIRRSLPEVRSCRAHSHELSIAGGGPSIADTKDDLKGYIASINGSLGYLTDQGIKPNACGILDPGEHIADMIEPVDGVHYYVASQVHPKVFDKLKDCHVIMWHASGLPGIEDLLRAEKPDDWFLIGGGSTMGLRWLNLGYVCGFRAFHCHGLDSSYRDGETHAYKDHERDQKITVNGRLTSPNFVQQVEHYGLTLERFQQSDMEPTEIKLYGEGLLQDSMC